MEYFTAVLPLKVILLLLSVILQPIVSLNDCGSTTCADCIGSTIEDGDPNCGWCSLNRTCTRRSACDMPDVSTRWLFYNETQCLGISSVTPFESQPHTVQQKVHVTVEQLPVKRRDYECVFDYEVTPSLSSLAVISSENQQLLICMTPDPGMLPAIPDGTDHITMLLSIRSTETGVKFVDTNHTFFECNTHKRCIDCSRSVWDCSWCVYGDRCTHDDAIDELCPDDDENTLIRGMEHHNSSVPRRGPTECAQLEERGSEVLVALGAEREINVVVTNLPDIAKVPVDNYTCVLDYEGQKVEVPAIRDTTDTDLVICQNSVYTYEANIQELTANLTLHWDWGGTRRTIDDEFSFQVTIFECEVGRSDCGPCLSCLYCNARLTNDGNVNCFLDVNANNVLEVSKLLAIATDTIGVLSAEDLNLFAGYLKDIAEVGDGSIEVTMFVVRIVSYIIDAAEETTSTPEFHNNGTTNSILQSLEMQVSHAVDANTDVTVIESNLAVSGMIVDDLSGEGIGFSIQMTTGESFANINSTRTFRMREMISDESPDAFIYVPLPNITASSQIKIIFIAYKGDTLFPTATTREDFLVGGLIISATVELINDSSSVQINEPIVYENALGPNVTVVRNNSDSRDSCNQDDERRYNRSIDQQGDERRVVQLEDTRCVFWDFEQAEGNGDWSEDGCRFLGEIDGRAACQCDHLTNFAILLNHGKEPILSKALDYFSKVGCALSLVSLVLTILPVLIFKKLRNTPRQILVHLCLSLILLYTTFLVGIDRTCPPTLCTVSAIVLHYAVLVSVALMVVEARYLYIKLVAIFDHESDHFVRNYAMAAWGLPIVIVSTSVSISFGLDLGYYQNTNYCFILPGPAVYYGVLLPIGLALFCNVATFIPITRSISRRRPGQTTSPSDDRVYITRARNAVAISSLLGLTWVFGFLAIDRAALAFQILFTVFNSLQGVFIFIFFSLTQKDVRQAVSDCFSQQMPRSRRDREGKEKRQRQLGYNYTNGDIPSSGEAHVQTDMSSVALQNLTSTRSVANDGYEEATDNE